MFIKLINGNPKLYSMAELRKDNPNVSFPANPSLEMLAKRNVFPCKKIQPFNGNDLAWKVVLDKFELVDDEWFQINKLEKLPLTTAEQNVRDRRNELLSASDWTQLADASVDKVAWSEYRQQLRDISVQPTFPYQVSWPAKPE